MSAPLKIGVMPRVAATEIQVWWSPPVSQWVAVGYNSSQTVSIATSPDGITWTDASNNPFSGGGAYGIAWNGSLWIAIGNNLDNTVSIATSPDGMTWTASENPFSGGVIGIVWSASASKWALVGYNQGNTVCIATSPNGTTWTDSSNNPFSGGYGIGIAYSQNKWVAVGANSDATVCIATSPDGMTWTDSSNNPFSGGGGQGIACSASGSKWVAVGRNQQQTVCIATSPDGMTWTDASNNPFFGGGGLGISHNGSYWVAVGYNHPERTVCIATSIDGMTWTDASNNPFPGYTGIGIAWSAPQNQWVAVGGNVDYTVCIATSPDGMTWTPSQNNPFSGGPSSGIALASSSVTNYVLQTAVPYLGVDTASGQLMYSGDGVKWVANTILENAYLLAYGNGMWLAVGYTSPNCVLYYSKEGFSWNSCFIFPENISITALIYSNGLWVMGSYGQDMYYSTDGLIWINTTSSINGCRSIDYGNNLWVELGDLSVSYSTDGIYWVRSVSNTLINFGTGVKYGKDASGHSLWVACGLDNTQSNPALMYSYNGKMWYYNTLGSGDLDGIPVSITYGNGVWIIGSIISINVIYYSHDGLRWTPSTSANDLLQSCNSVIYGKGTFIASGNSSGSKIIYSTDGVTWYASSSPVTNFIYLSYGDTNPIIIPAAETKGTYTVTGLTPLTDYTYMIQADCSGSYSDIAVYRTVKTSGRPQPVSGLTKSQSIVDGQLQVTFSWPSPSTPSSPSSVSDLSDYAQYYVYSLRVKGQAASIYEGQDIIKGDRWLAVGNSADSTVCVSSFDGVNWVDPVTAGGNDPFSGGSAYSVAYNGSYWVAGGVYKIAKSPDGITWTDSSNNPFLPGTCKGVAWSSTHSLWVIVGYMFIYGVFYASIASSPDGMTWTESASPFTGGEGFGIASSSDKFVAVGYNAGGTVCIAVSTDGVNWTPSTNNPFAGGKGNGITYSSSQNKWIAVGYNSDQSVSIAVSADGFNWTPSKNNPFAGGKGTVIASNGSRWVAAGFIGYPYIAVSSDGFTWILSTTNPFIYIVSAIYSIVWNPTQNYWILGAYGYATDGHTYITSPDGLNWSFNTDDPFGASGVIHAIAWNPSYKNSYTFTVDPTREYTFSIQRGNDAGYSSLVSIDTVATTFDPRSVPGLWLWLDANDVGNGLPLPVDTEFSVWKDKSGKENDAVLGAGAEHATVDGAGKYVSIGSTWFNLTKSSWAYNQYFTFFVVEHRATSAETIYIANRNNGADKIKIGYTDSASVIFSTYADNTILGSIDGINPPRINVLCFTNYGGKTAYWNKSISGKNINASFIVDSLLTIGASTNVGRNEVYEVLMYRGIMKEDDREAITNYLYDKWMPSSSVIQGPVQNGMLMWLDAADKATLIKDASGTPVEVHGDNIYQWKDKSGLGNDMFDQTTFSQYNLASGFPLFAAGGSVSTNSIIQTNDATVFLLLYTVDTDYNARTLFTHDVSGNYGLIITPTGKLSWRSGPTANNNQINFVAERFFLFYGTIKKGQLLSGTFIDQDGVQKVYDVDSFSYSLGSSPIILTNVAGRAVRYGEVIYYNRALSDAELEVNAEYLANKWGLISLAVASAPGFSGLQLWLDSSDPYTVFKTGSTVTSWHDKSGLENNAVAHGAPTSGNGITFHGSDYFSLPDGALPTGDYSYYIVSDFFADSAIVNGGSKDIVGMWVAVGNGSGSTIKSSYDGITWKDSGDEFMGGAGYGIAYSSSQNQWVAVGFSGYTSYILHSPDGMTWTPSTNNPFSGGVGLGIAYSSSKWVAVGHNSDNTVCIATSPDGTAWTDASNNPFSGAIGYGIAYSSSQNKWVAVGNNLGATVCIATSTDGMTWTDSSNNPFSGAYGAGIAYSSSQNKWVAVGGNSDGSVCIASSPDGITWTDASNNPFSGWSCTAIAYSGSLWIAIGHGPIGIATSTDGMTWTPNPTNPYYGGAAPFGIAWSESESYWTIVGAPGDSGSIFTSTDGITWTQASNNPSYTGRAVAYAEGTYHALRTNINVITDSSGTFAQTVYDYSSDRNMWINVDRSYSYDSVTWYDASGGNQLHNSIFYANGLWVAVGGYGFSYVYSTDGINWIIPGYGDNGFSVDKANAIVYANGLWITGGVNSPDINGYMIPPIAYSSDGINWNTATVTQIDDCKTIAYGKDSSGNDLWVVGSRSLANDYYALHYSANGMTWLTVSGSDTLFDVCKTVVYGKGIWLAGGTGPNTMMYSITGYTWIPDISGSALMSGACNSIALGEDLSGVELFVASGGSNGEYLAYSYDGLAWQTCIYDSESINTFGNVSYSNGLWLCPCDPVLATSRDGITWISSGAQNFSLTVIAGGRGSVTVNKSTLTDTNAIPYGREMGFVAVGTNTDNTVSIATSTDGLTWKLSFNNPFSGGGAYGIGWSGSYWVAVGNNSGLTFCIATSPDGITWTPSTNNPFPGGSGLGIAWSASASQWVAVGYSSTVSIATSPDGITWTDASNNPFSSGTGRGIAWNGEYWVAVGNNSDHTVCIATSTDGMTWTDASNNPFSGGEGYGIAYSSLQNKWVAVGRNSGAIVCIATSTDGMTWTDASNNPFSNGAGQGIAYSSSQNKWVAVGNNSGAIVCIATSPDGNTWTDSSNNPFYEGAAREIAWSSSHNKWVAVGSGTAGVCIATSPDGMTWTPASNNPFNGGEGYGIASGMISLPVSKTVIVESIKGASRSMFLSGLTGATDSATHIQDSTQNYIGWDLSGYMHGTIKEMLVYNTAHNAEKRLQVERYLKNKWFPTAFKPTDVSGASLWLDASEDNFIYGSKDRIQTWKDKTGNCIVKQDVPWAQPIYSLDSVTGLRGVQFGADAIANGLIDISGSPFGSGNSWSVFTVHRYDYSTDLDEAVNGCVCTVYEASSGAPTEFKAGSTFVTLENDVVPSELKLTEGSSAAISADVRGRPVMTGQLVNSLTPAHTVNGADYPIGSGLIVAGGYNSGNTVSIATSTDGITWTDSSNNPFSGGNAFGIAYSPPLLQWVAVGLNAYGVVCIASSPDGMTWTDSSNNPFDGGYGHGIAWSTPLSQWVAVGTGSVISIATSTDGMTWTDVSNNPFDDGLGNGIGNGIAWSEYQSKWVAVGANSSQTVCIATSTDGINWTSAYDNPFSGANCFGIAYSSSLNRWVAVGNNSSQTVSIATSPDGMTWTDSSNNPFSGGGGQGIAWSPLLSQWVAVGGNSSGTVNIASSPDGITWTDASNNPFSGAGTGIVWNISYWVAVGYNSSGTVSIATSPDGMTWVNSVDAGGNNPFSGGQAYAVAVVPQPIINPMANARMNIGFTAPLTPALGGAMRGYIYEILCYRGAVSPSDQQKIEGYLAWKWGIQDVLAQTHPYYLGPP